MNEKHVNIHEAINAVMQEVGYVQKQRTAGLNYSYAGEAALIEALRPVMVAHGIYCYPVGYDNLAQTEYMTKNGAPMTRTTLRATFRFQHSDTFVDAQIYGESADSGDKSVNKAMTDAYKYVLRQTFCIETGDDPDNFASQPKTYANTPVSHSSPTPKVIQKPAEMPLDLAESETNSKGELYINIDTETLTHMVNTMAKMLKKPETTAEQAEEYNRKIAAAKAIIASR